MSYAKTQRSKVSLVRCPDYDPGRVGEALTKAVGLIGGMREFVSPGMKVLLKPNLLSPRPPADAVDTHPEIVRALVRLVKGVGGIPVIGDSPGGYGSNVEEVFKISGMKDVALEEKVELVRFTSSRIIDGFPIARHIFDCDRFISVPKLKTHSLTVFTGAVKNTFGAVTGLAKAECHARAPRIEEFAKVIARVHAAAKPHLNILDGVDAMEGDGPSSGVPRRLQVIMASRDAVAIDACIASIIGLRPLDLAVIKEAVDLGLGEGDPSTIDVLGERIDDFKVSDFKFPRTMPLSIFPKAVVNGLAALVSFRPYIVSSRCTHCNLCKVSCPVAAIHDARAACVIDKEKCIKCMCCHEVCPYKAIDIKRNFLAKMLLG